MSYIETITQNSLKFTCQICPKSGKLQIRVKTDNPIYFKSPLLPQSTQRSPTHPSPAKKFRHSDLQEYKHKSINHNNNVNIVKRNSSFGTGIKNWIGFPSPENIATIIRRISVKLGKKIHSPHFSLGWCKTRRDFYNFSAENIQIPWKELFHKLSSDFYFKYQGYTILGKKKNKLAILFQPIMKKKVPEDTLENYSKEILQMWRNEAIKFGISQNKPIKLFKNTENTLEFAAMDREIIFEMRAIKIKFHLTVGKATEQNIEIINTSTFPDMYIDTQIPYISPGKTTPFTVQNLPNE